LENWTKDKFRLLALLAHPDDETFRPGGTLALLAQLGVKIQVVSATNGDAGSCGVPPLCKPQDLSRVRRKELQQACITLGILPPQFLDYRDGFLNQADTKVGIQKIQSMIQNFIPQVLLSFGPDGLSGHPDHIEIGKWAQEAYQDTEQVAALYTLAVPKSLADQLNLHQVIPVNDDEIALEVDISSVWKTKLAAIHCHATQLSSTPLLRASEERKQKFFCREYYTLAAERNSRGNFLPVFLKDYII
jgi:N-acetylglucosamine malate deacetylase 2